MCSEHVLRMTLGYYHATFYIDVHLTHTFCRFWWWVLKIHSINKNKNTDFSGFYQTVRHSDVPGRRSGVDLNQQLLHAPQDVHLQRLVLFGHQSWQVPAGSETRDCLHHRWEGHSYIVRPQRARAGRAVLCLQPLHVALRVQLGVAASIFVRGGGVLLQLRYVEMLSVRSAAGTVWKRCHIGCLAAVGASRWWGWRWRGNKNISLVAKLLKDTHSV